MVLANLALRLSLAVYYVISIECGLLNLNNSRAIFVTMFNNNLLVTIAACFLFP